MDDDILEPDDNTVKGVELLRAIGGRLESVPEPTDQSIEENRANLIAGVASDFLERRLSGNLQLEALKGNIVSKLLERIEDLPLDMLVSTLDVVNKATASDSSKLLDILSRGGPSASGTNLNIFVNGGQPEQKVSEKPVPKVGNKDYKRLSTIYDAYNILMRQAETAEDTTPQAPTPPTPEPAPESANDPQEPKLDTIQGDDI